MLADTFSMENYHAFQRPSCGGGRMMYKAEGGGLQAYGIFQKGYTYQIFICNDPLSKTYLSKSMSPLGFRVVELLDTE